MAASVVRIAIAPVKALGLVHPEEVDLGSTGVLGDRRFWLVDANGRLANGKAFPRLMQVRPEWDEATRRLVLTFPGGEVAEGIVEPGEPVEAALYGEPHPSRAVPGPWQPALSEIDGVAAHEEDEWIGGRVAIGGATVAVVGDVGRCVVTTRDPDTGVSDLDTLGALSSYRRLGRTEPLPMGVFGDVVVPGRVRLG